MRRVLVLVPLIALACPASRGGFPWPLTKVGSSRVDVAEVTTIQPYDRRSSRVLARSVRRATRANLDLAAYHANVLIRQPLVGDPIAPGQARVPERPFDGALERESIVASLDRTPLTAEEKRRPLAFAPLVDYLARWDAEQAAGLEEARAAVRGESWGLPRRPGTYFQQITTLFLHGGELWVKVELEPWARLFEELPDEDGDGYPELYGRLKASLHSGAVLERIRADYAGRVLSTAEAHAWANELASYWYPSYNTDVVKLRGATRWPLASVEPEVRKASAGLTLDRPVVVIRGKPQGQAIYTVLAVDGIAPMDAKQAVAAAPPSALKATPVSPEPGPLRRAIEAELEAHGGSFAAWAAELAPTHAALRAQLARRPEALKALVGRRGFLFYRRSLDYVVGGDIQAQPPNKNPLRAIVEFKDYLAGLGVDFLLVPVPTKAEVFPDRLPGVTLDRPQVLSPFGRKFLLELSRAGVEVVALLPRSLEARGAGKPGKGDEPLYQPQDTHWTDRGLRLAAEVIARRIQRYPWWSELAKNKVAFTLKRTSFKRQGDLVSRLLEKEQRRFRPARLVAHQVLAPAGELYEDDAASPIVVLGDSFTGVYERTDCGSAGVSAHIAHRLQHPVDLVMSYGGGPNVRNKLLSRDEKTLGRMRLVVWLFAARDFFNYWDDWAPLETRGSRAKGR